jgi:hypothetical protein
MPSSNPFSMDTAEHIAQTQGLVGLVHESQANIKRTMAVADSYHAVHQGEMAKSVNTALDDLHATLTQNNQVLEGITDALHTTQNIVGQGDSDGSALVAKAASSMPHGFFGHH